MKHAVILQSAVAALILSGCVPLEQAPLVYASRVQMGVGVTAGTAESPGLDVTIGYKQIDAAFVPVAVAKTCGDGQDCAGTDYNIGIIKGTNNRNGQSIQDDAAIQRADMAVIVAQQKIDQASEKIAAADKKLAEIGTLQAKKDEQKTLKDRQDAAQAAVGVDAAPVPAPVPLTPTEIATLAKLNLDVPKIELLSQSKSTIKKEYDDQTALLEKATVEEQNAKDKADKIRAQQNKRNNDDKIDAYSVYGSFNGDASGRSEGAGLTLGKVFSTGVAAQHISQGIGNSARVEAMAKCLNAARQIVKDVTSEAVLLAALGKCDVAHDE